MEWHVEVHEEGGIIGLMLSGPATLEQMAQVGAEVIETARRQGFGRYFADARDMTFAVSDILLYDLPGRLEEHGLSRSEQVAVVYPMDSAQKETFLFLENIFVNRGFRFRVFTDVNDAMAWLKDSSRASSDRAS
jgi:hypothetical protein